MGQLCVHSDPTLTKEFRNIYTLLERLLKQTAKVVVGDLAPTDPADNTVWVNGTAHTVQMWDGSQWVVLS
jgi:hypothetical protein